MLSDERIEEIANEVAAPVSRYLPYWRTSVDFARAIEAAVLPKGYVLVPKELPIEFAAWVCREVPSGTFINDPHWWAPRLYKAMLAAAPKSARYETWTDARCAIGTCEDGMDHDPKCEKAEKQEPAKDEPYTVDVVKNGAWKKPERVKADLTAEVERLRQICRDAYEVWAGSNGIPEPITCAEAYLLQLLIQMRDEVKRGLK